MPIAIKSMSLDRTFSETEYDARIINFINDSVLRVTGSIRRTVGDNIVFNLYSGHRTEYLKNGTTSIPVKANGDYDITVELFDGAGVYYLTTELLLDDGTYDILTKQIILEDRVPIINEFNILNYDSIVQSISGESSFLFFSETRNVAGVTFTALNNDNANDYFYKLWLSYEDEPLRSIPLTGSQNFVNVDISQLTNGDYFIYLKIIDSAGNTAFSRKKISVFKVFPEVEINYIKIISDNYFISLKDIEPAYVELLVDIKAGARIDTAELRLYKDDKIITFKNPLEESRIESVVNENIKKSGFFYFPKIDVKRTWNLSVGNYQLELFYTDIFGREFTSNRSNLYVKDKTPVLTSAQLDLFNPASLVLDSKTKIPFSLKEEFFKLNTKQIDVYRQTNNPTDENQREFEKVNSLNSSWVFNGVDNSWETYLGIFFNDAHINKTVDNFLYNYYEFRITNDFGELGIFRVPIVYKPERNKIVLHNDFIYPVDNTFPIGPDGKNSYLSNLNDDNTGGDFLIPFGMFDFTVGFKIINDVDFGDLFSYKTNNHELVHVIDEESIFHTIEFNDRFFIDLNLVQLEDDTDNMIYPELDVVSFYTSENVTTHEKSDYSNFNLIFLDEDDIKLPTKTFHGISGYSNFLEPLNEDINLVHPDISISKFNKEFSWINFTKKHLFNNFEWRTLIEQDTEVRHSKNYFSNFNYPLNIFLYKDLSTVFGDIKLPNVIYDNKYDVKIPFQFNNDLLDNLLFFVDHNLEFDEDTVLENKNDFLVSDKFHLADEYTNGEFVLKNVPVYKEYSTTINYSTVYYKYKEVNKINSFKVFYTSNNEPLDVSFSISNNNNIFIKKESLMTVTNNTPGHTNVKSTNTNSMAVIRVYSNNSQILSFIPNNDDVFNININKYNSDGTTRPDSIYFNISGYYSISLEVDFNNSVANDIRLFKTKSKTVIVSDQDFLSSVSISSSGSGTSRDFISTYFNFSSHLRHKATDIKAYLTLEKIKEFNSNGDIIDSTNSLLTEYIRIFRYKTTFSISDFLNGNFSEGLYSIKLKIEDQDSYNFDSYDYNVQLNTSEPVIEVSSPDISDIFVYCREAFADVTLMIKKDFNNFENGKLIFTVTNNNAVKRYVKTINTYEDTEFQIPISNGDNSIEINAYNDDNNTNTYYKLPNTFVYEDNFSNNNYNVENINIVNGNKMTNIHSVNSIYSYDKTTDTLNFDIQNIDPNIYTYLVIDDDFENPIDINTLLTGGIFLLPIDSIDEKVSFYHEDFVGNTRDDITVLIYTIGLETEFDTSLFLVNKVNEKDNEYIVMEIYHTVDLYSPNDFYEIRTSLRFHSYDGIITNKFFNNVQLNGVLSFNSLSVPEKIFFIDLGIYSIKRYRELFYIKNNILRERIISISALLYFNLFISRSYIIDLNIPISIKKTYAKKIDLNKNDMIIKTLRGDSFGI